LQNELANGRVLLSGGKSGIEIIRDLKDKTLAGLDTYAPVKMNSVSYKAAQDFMDKTLQKGAKIRTLTGMNPYSYNSENKPESAKEAIKEQAKEFKSETISMRGPDGKVYSVPQGKAQRFVENGFKRV
jgi:hypothetical protein